MASNEGKDPDSSAILFLQAAMRHQKSPLSLCQHSQVSATKGFSTRIHFTVPMGVLKLPTPDLLLWRRHSQNHCCFQRGATRADYCVQETCIHALVHLLLSMRLGLLPSILSLYYFNQKTNTVIPPSQNHKRA